MDTAGSCRFDNHQYDMVFIKGHMSRYTDRQPSRSRSTNEIYLLQRVGSSQLLNTSVTRRDHRDRLSTLFIG
jgi:hypothetical protein